jgi:hypothetical protein
VLCPLKFLSQGVVYLTPVTTIAEVLLRILKNRLPDALFDAGQSGNNLCNPLQEGAAIGIQGRLRHAHVMQRTRAIPCKPDVIVAAYRREADFVLPFLERL